MAHKPTTLESLKSADGGGTFEDMEHRVAFLEKSFGKMDGKLDVILNGLAGLKEDVSILKGDVSGLKGDVSVLKGDVSGLKGDVTGLKGDISGLKGDVSGLKEGLAYLKGRIDHLPTMLQLLGFVLAIFAMAGFFKYFTP
ncbi:hypothetical protein [Phyllobacterium zundukense]|jgi:hypothetical protein|uniref:Uncharacterized protein n=1 Tax=Phyllobacterium zundukense TaxID=1867719 RepID=A0ACD4D4G0_9HYPH|nr:hypothetical protein [Phyllobacterium zundukense]UXN60732.1 hypothetical protein N8E88_30375 [Phyllobacterium zundukense]